MKVIGQDPASASKARRFIEDDDEGPGSAQTVVNIIGEPGSGQVGVPIIRAPTVAPVATVAPADKSAEVLDVPMQSGEAVESAVSAFASEDELTASAAAALVKSGGKPGDLSTPKPSRSSSKGPCMSRLAVRGIYTCVSAWFPPFPCLSGS